MSVFARARSDNSVASITTAAPSRQLDIDTRARRYVISMVIRTVCVMGAVVVDGWLRWACLFGAIFLPWIAVVFANATNRSNRSRIDEPHFEYRALPRSPFDP